MSSIKSITLTLAALCLIAAISVNSAPTDTETSSPAAATTTAAATASSAPTTPANAQEASSTASMAVSSAQEDMVQPIVNTSFTCYNRKVGYYADMEAECKVYHFCMLGDYNGQEMYQRVSYLCLNGTIFDQQALDCVEPAKMTGPCADSEKHYEDSNAVLRKAIVGKPEMDEHAPAAAATPSAPAAAPASEAPAATTTASTSSSTTAVPTTTRST